MTTSNSDFESALELTRKIYSRFGLVGPAGEHALVAGMIKEYTDNAVRGSREADTARLDWLDTTSNWESIFTAERELVKETGTWTYRRSIDRSMDKAKDSANP